MPNSIDAYVASILAGDEDVADGEVAANLALALQGEQAWSARRSQDIGDFLCHVVRTIPFYQSWFAGRSFRATKRLEEFPLTSRRDLEFDRNRLISVSYQEDASVFKVSTSGSLGRRIPISYDLASSYGTNYASYAAVAAAVPGLSDCMKAARRGVVLVDNSIPCQAITLFVPCLNYSLLQRFCLSRSEEELRAGIGDLRRESVPLLYSKPHYLLELAGLDRKLGTEAGRISARALLVSGENLYEDQRAKLEHWFGGPVYNAYTSAEGGFIALECNYHTGLHVQCDRLILEVLSSDRTVCDEGTGELVLTNFSNWAMGFVRYRTGDRGTIQNIRCPCGFCGPTLTDLPGRDVVRFVIPSGAIECRSLEQVFALLPVQQFQIAQHSRNTFAVRWVPDLPAKDTRETEQAIRRGLLERMGDDVMLSVEAVAHIVPPPGGKVRRYVCN